MATWKPNPQPARFFALLGFATAVVHIGRVPDIFLKDVVTTLSTENKARVLIITDACRSGKLAGNSIGGAQLTSQNLAQQFANEIKILSCQPNEYSLEGEQWGGALKEKVFLEPPGECADATTCALRPNQNWNGCTIPCPATMLPLCKMTRNRPSIT
ncbi:MAG: hypothetical protein IPH31_18130 [Lewinellaceae bacterium]|nr:hypothetical protein [Lewinellaceae bacterium]